MFQLFMARTARETAWMSGKELGDDVERRPGFAHRVVLATLRRERRARDAARAEAGAGPAAAGRELPAEAE
ncbi:MAG: hypothetical protein KatS3mg062_0680 [Tepidiforma sp.]|nr:MAG: hypothetical protein KatS3mg062_0680 [Tepidiforma sp.]